MIASLFNDDVFHKFPVLETPRLLLREIGPADKDDIHSLYSNPLVLEYFGKEPFHSDADALTGIRVVQTAFFNEQGIRWGIELKADKKYIGSIGFWRLLKEHRRAEIGYELAPASWNQGIMQESMKAILQFGFDTMNLHSVEANVTPENQRSVTLLEKCGFNQEGLFRENYYFNGVFLDTVSYSLRANEFKLG